MPDGSLAENSLITEEKKGEKIKANIWFPYVDKEESLIEYKIFSERYDQMLTLIVLPRSLNVRKQTDDE
jgi:hypothetical protein